MHGFVFSFTTICSLIGMVLLSCETTVPTRTSDVVMVTELGDIHLSLYDATPIHKANFLKLVESGFYDGMAFHRVIYDFMVQAGDPRTQTAYPVTDADAPDGPGYTLPAEIVDSLVHTPGKIGAARWEDAKNPERRSSGSQFYIITGEDVVSTKLDSNEVMYTGMKRGEIFGTYQAALDSGDFSGSFDAYLTQHNFTDFHYPIHQRNRYLEEGGAPWLDFQYTIFGEVTQGMDIIEKIERTPCDDFDRPQKPIRILKMRIVSNKQN